MSARIGSADSPLMIARRAVANVRLAASEHVASSATSSIARQKP
jgi:hypothetical protein